MTKSLRTLITDKMHSSNPDNCTKLFSSILEFINYTSSLENTIHWIEKLNELQQELFQDQTSTTNHKSQLLFTEQEFIALCNINHPHHEVFQEYIIKLFENNNFLDSPVPTVNPGCLNINQNIAQAISEANYNINQYFYLRPKTEGANDPGPKGGFYLSSYYDSEQNAIKFVVLLCKRATDSKTRTANIREVISEGLAGKLMNFLIGEQAAQTFFVVDEDNFYTNFFPKNPENVYIASLCFPDWKSIYQVSIMEAKKNKKPDTIKRVKNILGIPLGGGVFSGQLINCPGLGHPSFRKGMIKLHNDNRIDLSSLARTIFSAILLGNNQIHSENIGLTLNQNGEYYARIIDFGASFRRLFDGKKELDGSFPYFVNPTNYKDKKLKTSYFLSYPNEIRSDDQFQKGLEEVISKCLDVNSFRQAIEQAVDHTVKIYGAEVFIQYFAQELDTHNKFHTDPDKAIENTKSFLEDAIQERVNSLDDFASVMNPKI